MCIGGLFCGVIKFLGVLLPTACSDGDLRLVNSTSDGEGRVELCVNNTYGSICADFWDEVDAQVVCGQLGFLRNGQDTLKLCSYKCLTSELSTGSQPSRFDDVGDSDVDIFLSTVHCDGTEARLIACSSTANGNCNNNELAGVKCEGKN